MAENELRGQARPEFAHSGVANGTGLAVAGNGTLASMDALRGFKRAALLFVLGLVAYWMCRKKTFIKV